MPFAFAYVLVSYHCISGHRIRFNVSFTCGRRLAMPKVRRTNNASSMLFLCKYAIHRELRKARNRRANGIELANYIDVRKD